MQLFSLGLWVLHEDGTQKLDNSSNPIPTYDNTNIVEFAKIWTGFMHRDVRGNIEQKRISDANHLDPMVVDPLRRDALPKMNLYSGHIGDAYPLCKDLPSRSFLRIGAQFRFLGSNPEPDLVSGSRSAWDFGVSPPVNQPMFSPDVSASALYAALCNADSATGTCRFQSVITLDHNLQCHGSECILETLRWIKLAVGGSSPIFYEYVRVPCVTLTFFVGAEGGRFIDNVNHIPSHGNTDELIERVCADPEALVAAPGCCTAGNHRNCFEYRCAYVDERVSLTTALQRCNTTALWSNAGNPPPLPTGVLANWSLYPEVYRTEPTACPAGSSTANESYCLQAATAAMAAAGEPYFNTPRNFKAGSWGNQPFGCYVKTNSRDVQYNRRVGGVGHSDSKLVCNNVAPAARSAYRNADKLLCSRKRRHCWWKDSADNCDSGFDYGRFQAANVYWWTQTPCYLQAQVNIDGRVSVVHSGSESIRRVGINNGNWFRVRWSAGNFPKAAAGCSASSNTCSIVRGENGDTCLCGIDMTTSAVFTDTNDVPGQE
eukprot:COSAG01_NODE_423_length_17260_cov_203.736962_16_plen_544_part_00